MKQFSKSPGGHGYVWKEAATSFDVYDFNSQKYKFDITWLPVHMADILEASSI